MLSSADFIHLSHTRDLIEGGIAYALHALPYQFQRAGSSPYDRLRRAVAGTAVELAFRRYLSGQKIPFEVKRALPFTEHEHYDVMLAGRRCEIKSFLMSHRDQVSQIQDHPEVVSKAPALVASDQHAAEGHSPNDLYLFAFVPGLVTTTRDELQGMIEAGQPYCLVHVMPEVWKRPSKWSPLGKLVLKSESEETQIVEVGGQDQGRGMCSLTVKLPPCARVEIPDAFFSLSYIHTKSVFPARIGIYSPVRRETHLIGRQDWGNLWIYGTDILLAGYITREEFSRRARFLPAGSRAFQYTNTQVKNLAVPVSGLRPLLELFQEKRSFIGN
jgi:hypothetical protein